MDRAKIDIAETWKKYKKAPDLETRNILVEYYLPIVRYTAERMIVKLPHNVDLQDLISAGIFGLVDAVDKFDIGRGVKFETYCRNRIRGAILDELRSLDWVPRLVRAKSHKLERALSQLEIRLGRPPTDAEIADNLGISMEELDDLLRETNTVSILPQTKTWTGSEDAQVLGTMDIVESKRETNPLTEVQRRELVEYALNKLSRKERLVMVLYYFEELTMKEIGATLDLSESRVCQIHAKVVARLRGQLARIRAEGE